MFRKLIITTAAVAAGAAAVPGTAAADIIGTPPPCVRLSDVTGPDFDVKQCGVSDVDQYRAGLEANGSSYCGPSSLYNVLHYWSHVKNAPVGWQTTKVGNLDPLDQADYNVITNSIGRIGVDAQYDLEDGTNLGNLQTAWKIATKPARDAGWATGQGNVNSSVATDFGGDLAKRLNVGPLQMSYGRYYAGPKAGSWERSGGHIVTVVAAKGSFGGDTVQIKIADPAQAADHNQGDFLKTQSSYILRDLTLKKVSFNEYVPVADDPDTATDESLLPGTYRSITRWELVTPFQGETKRVMIENFNWFVMAPPVG
ncbi:hypothetical protein [Alloactinosynnema sp. L-07]|uniref:hypothetical protein n=1 Tax=Alloactinosynnema sp. L-07 TaxID=1653480 RepID=UPI00065F08EC|nr:hypothetical protein [Alloactinosynnema sp. L-07]CRK59806.1 hypothetical protein [Alloactinosynnema sp. L-07]